VAAIWNTAAMNQVADREVAADRRTTITETGQRDDRAMSAAATISANWFPRCTLPGRARSAETDVGLLPDGWPLKPPACFHWWPMATKVIM